MLGGYLVPMTLAERLNHYLQQPGEKWNRCSTSTEQVLYAIHAPEATQTNARRIFTYSTPFLMNELPSVRMPNRS